jgi:APA family basic amino acid/polyamine antiporter
VTFAVYAAVAGSALVAVGADALAESRSPLATAVEAGSLDALTPAVRVGAAVASLGVLLSLLAGVSRTAFAMAANRELPHWFAAVHPRYKIPHRAEVAIGLVVAAVVAVADLRSAIGFSSFAVLLYYAVANASALTLSRSERRWPLWISALGLVGCVTLAVTLPALAVAVGAGVLAAGAGAYLLLRTRRGVA